MSPKRNLFVQFQQKGGKTDHIFRSSLLTLGLEEKLHGSFAFCSCNRKRNVWTLALHSVQESKLEIRT